ncbi:ATP-binding cassette domain-containing protein [Dietzia cinnamea]|uniref:ATP-binding cassette domain-containing protein n=1 Tax=Dietzia cinnamea TaxID=321318 RepID=UPI0021A2F3D2|nr:ATP-binding cassette domain-containing protein [Dietzia cinnamea]MCT2273872.1 ATP-binding cassette domain-containing protein [Dietzia cinnamea]
MREGPAVRRVTVRPAARRIAGTAMLAAIVVFALLWPVLAPDAMTTSDYLAADLPPSPAHPMGTDALGHDLSALVARALQVSLAVAAGSAALAGLLGVVVGTAAAAGGRRVDAALMRVTDAVAAVPHLLATVVVVALFRGSLAAIVLALALTHWPGVARVVRAEAQKVMATGYVAASRAAGASPAQVARWHVVPAVAGQAGLAVVLMVPHAVWHESTLSFLGIGLSPERASLGTLVAMSQSGVLMGRWWPLVFPTAALIAVTAAVALLGPGRAGRGAGSAGGGRGGRVASVPAVGDDDDEARTTRAALRVDGLTVRHGGSGADAGETAVDGVSLRVEPGRVVAIVGPSGAGKSSLLDACAGFVAPGSVVAGRVEVGGRGMPGHVAQTAADAFTPTRHLRGQLEESIAVAAARGSATGTGSVPAGGPTDVAALCRLVGVDPALADRYPHQLSGGQLRRMAIAVALGTWPSVLLADEPTAGLDPALALAVLRQLRRLADETGVAVLLATHDLVALEASGAADEVVSMQAGRLCPADPSQGNRAPADATAPAGELVTP